MKETFSSLVSLSHTYTNTVSTDTAANTFLKKEIALTCRDMLSELSERSSNITKTTSTVASRQYYYKPVDMGDIETVTITIGSVIYSLISVDSQDLWNKFNAITFAGTAIPFAFFNRRDDVGIYPIPQDAYTMTMVFKPRYKDISVDDYITGDVTVTNNSQIVTGSGTAFTASMMGRWFKTNNDGMFYRILSYQSATQITLENVFQGSTASSQAYVIGESPEIPDEAQRLIPYRAAETYYLVVKKDPKMAMYMGNMFFTGDPQNSSREIGNASGGWLYIKNAYKNRSSTGIVRRNLAKVKVNNSKLWATTITP